MKLRLLTAGIVCLSLSASVFAQKLPSSNNFTPTCDDQKSKARYQQVCPGGVRYMSLKNDGLPATADKATLENAVKSRKAQSLSLGGDGEGSYPFPVQMYDYMDYCWTPDTVSKSYTEDDELLWNLPKFDFYNFHKPQYGMGCGAFIENGKMHTFVSNFLYGFMGQYQFDMVTYNADNMQVISHKSFDKTDISYLCIAQCQYPLDEKKGIGIFYNKEADGLDWVIMDFDNQTLDRVATCKNNYGILVTDGTWLYGWRDDNCIYKIDPQTFEATKVGAHGFKQYIPNESGGMQAYTQSATYDKNTKTCYWGAFSAKTAETGFFKVDLQTAKIEKIFGTYVTQHLGMCTNPETVDDNAPGPVTDFTLSFEGAARSGTATFTLPTLNYKGDQTLSDTLSYKITQGSTTLAKGTELHPGDSVTVNLSLRKDGNYVFNLQTQNSIGWSKSAKVRKYVGYDTPETPASATLDIAQDGTVNLHWTAPSVGTNEGALGNIVYDVYRIHGSETKMVSLGQTDTTFTEKLSLAAITSYKYAIVADNQGHQSDFCYSNVAACGKPYECPVVIDFTDESVFNLFTVDDVNNDGATWSWDDDKDYLGYARCKTFNSEYASNDWLFSPVISLKAGRTYTLSYVATSYLLGFPEYMSISLGKGKTPESMTKQLVAKTLAPGAKRTRKVSFTVNEDGEYNLGFKACSDVNMFYLMIYGFRLDVEPLDAAPAAVDNFTCTPGDKGAKYATVKFNAPTKTVAGEALTSISKISLERDINEVQTWENVKPGDALEFTDVVSTEGYHDWIVRTYGNDTQSYDNDTQGYDNLLQGDYKEQKLYLGKDVPATPQNGIIKDYKDSIEISWDPVTTGAHGGYVDPDDIQYEVRNYNHQVQGYTKDTHLVLKCNDADEVLKFDNTDNCDLNLVYYRLTAINSLGSVPNSDTEKALFGPISQLPFTDSAPKGQSEALWWDVETDNETNYIMGLGSGASSDGDNGCFGWQCLTATDNFSMRTTKLDFTNVKNPKVQFDICTFVKNFTVSVRALTPEHEYINIADIDMADVPLGGWVTITANIPMEVANSRYDIIDFHFTGMKDKSYLYLDNVKIYDDEVDGIENVTQSPTTQHPSPLYNVQGARVSGNYKGIVISNGKKYLNK